MIAISSDLTLFKLVWEQAVLSEVRGLNMNCTCDTYIICIRIYIYIWWFMAWLCCHKWYKVDITLISSIELYEVTSSSGSLISPRPHGGHPSARWPCHRSWSNLSRGCGRRINGNNVQPTRRGFSQLGLEGLDSDFDDHSISSLCVEDCDSPTY